MSSSVTISRYDQPSDAMMKRAREWLEFAMLRPSYERDFQNRLTEAQNAVTISFDDAMTFAHAAMMVAENGESQTFAMWYREIATLLFCQAYNAVAIEREARAATESGKVQ